MAFNGNNTRFPKSITQPPHQGDLYNVYEEIGSAFPPPPGDYLLLEDMSYILQEDGLSKFKLEDDGGLTSLLLSQSGFYILANDGSHIKTASSI